MSVKKAIPSYQIDLGKLISQLGQMLPAPQFSVFNNDAEQLAKKITNPLKLKAGDIAPNFSLTNATGKTIQLKEVLKESKVVLSFYRGAWCPYCNLQLNQFQQILPEIQEAGAQLIAISPQNPDHSLDMTTKANLEFEVLTDSANLIAKQYTTVFKNGEAPIKAMTELGYDFLSFYDDDSAELPVPATFVIDKNGIIQLAYSGGGDYRERIEPHTILAALKNENV